MESMIATGGTEIWTEDTGGEGLPIVFLHPGIADSRIWDPVLGLLGAQYRAIRFDVRGIGRSPASPTNWDPAADFDAVLDHYAIDRALFVGCSMGSQAAIDLAIGQPGRVAGLVLTAPGVSGYAWPAEPETVVAELNELCNAGDLDGLTQAGLRMWAAEGGVDPFIESLMRSAAKVWLGGSAPQEPPSALDRLAGITAPTVVIIGGRDRKSALGCSEFVAAAIPGARRLFAAESDHFVPVRVPELVAEVIREMHDAVSSPPESR